MQVPPPSAADMMWRSPYAARLYFYILSKTDENGEWKVSAKDIKADLGLTRQQYRAALDVLEATIKTTKKGTKKGTVISICKSDNKPSSATIRTTINATIKKAIKKTSKFAPPTHEQAQAYIDEKGFHWGCADMFIDFYTAKGWKVGNQPMKDWKAAMRTWENKWKEKYGATEDRYKRRRGTDAGDAGTDYGGAF